MAKEFEEQEEIMELIRTSMYGETKEENLFETPPRSVQKGESMKCSLVSMLVNVKMPLETKEVDIRAFFVGIGTEMIKRNGFRSRKVIDSPKTQTCRVFYIIIKFDNYEDLAIWENSPELQKWIDFGKSHQFVFHRTMVNSPLLRVNLSVLTEDQHKAPNEKMKNANPPKWKLWLLIWFFVFICVRTSAFAQTREKVNHAIHGDFAFSLLVSLATVVPLMAYCLLPLAMSSKYVKKWLLSRPYDLETTPWIFIRVLDKGLTIFRQPTSDTSISSELLLKIHELENKVEFLKTKFDETVDVESQRLLYELPEDEDELSKFKHQHSVELSSQGGGGSKEDREKKLEIEKCRTNEDSCSNVDIDKRTGEVTITVRHNIKWEHSKEFEHWNLKMALASYQFDNSFCGSDVFNRTYKLGLSDDHLPPARLPMFDSEYVVMFRFSNKQVMENWLSSNLRAKLLLELQQMLASESTYKEVLNEVTIGEEEGGASGSLVNAGDIFGELLIGESAIPASSSSSPPLYRTTILTLLGLFLVVWPLDYRLNPSMVKGGITSPSLVILCSTCVTVFANAYISSPLVFFFFATWLQRPPPQPQGPILKILTIGLPNNYYRAAVSVAWFLAHFLAAFVK